MEGGLRGMQQLLQSNDMPTAILRSNDISAFGVMRAALGAELRIPDGRSFVGFDDVHIAQFTVPPLTTIRLFCRDLAQGAMAILCSGLRTGKSTNKISHHY